MIRVKNTVELQENYKLSDIADSERVVVYGGLYNKKKYNLRRYMHRISYSGRDIKRIIVKMQEIESVIPNDWSQMQKAKFIYERLGKSISYGHTPNFSPYDQQDSNLTVILNGKAVCAGYSLLYKEMMDRQGIKCEYLRGNVPSTQEEEGGKHAWNCLTIDGKNIPVDLTWDSSYIKETGQLAHFGYEKFNTRHISDKDENQYDFTYLTPEEVEAIDTKLPNKDKRELDLESKRVYVENALHETYKKYAKKLGDEKIRNQCTGAVIKYIKTEIGENFTNENKARDNMLENVSQDDMLRIISSMYVDKIEDIEVSKNPSFDNAIATKLYDTNKQEAADAIYEYLSKKDVNAIGEENLELDKSEILCSMSRDVVNRYIDERKKAIDAEALIKRESTYDNYELTNDSHEIAEVDEKSSFKRFWYTFTNKIKSKFKKDKRDEIKVVDLRENNIKIKENVNIQSKEYSEEDIERLKRIANDEYVPRHAKEEDEIERK